MNQKQLSEIKARRGRNAGRPAHRVRKDAPYTLFYDCAVCGLPVSDDDAHLPHDIDCRAKALRGGPGYICDCEQLPVHPGCCWMCEAR